MKKNKKTTVKAKSVYYAVLCLLYVYLFGATVYKYCKFNDLKKSSFEIAIIFVLAIIMIYIQMITTEKQSKRKVWPRKIDEIKRRKERMKLYLGESILFSLILTTILYLFISFNVIYINFDIIFGGHLILAILLIALLMFICFFIIGFISNYLISEVIYGKKRKLKK